MKKKIAIIGAGAIGCYYGARLAAAGHDVVFLMRSDFDHVTEHGLSIQSIAGDLALPDVNCVKSTAEIGEVDWVVVAWKTTSNAFYHEVIAPLLGEDTLIITLQNGMGNTEALADLFGAQRILGGLCFVCINRISPGNIHHSASGPISLGEFFSTDKSQVSARLEGVASVMQSAGIEARPVKDLDAAQWMKLVWNVPFNGLAVAMAGIDTKELLAMPGMEKRIRLLMAEVCAAAAAHGHTIEPEFCEKQISATHTMGAYRPSSMIDYVEGKPVEIDAIWREPVLRAEKAGVDVPEMRRLLHEIEKAMLDRQQAQ